MNFIFENKTKPYHAKFKLSGLVVAMLLATTGCTDTNAISSNAESKLETTENLPQSNNPVSQGHQSQSLQPQSSKSENIQSQNTQSTNSQSNDTKNSKDSANSDGNNTNQSTNDQSSSEGTINATGTINSTENDVLPTLKYNTENLTDSAIKVNNSSWQQSEDINREVATKLQALLNWNHHGVGAVDGRWGKNTRKAMQAFQKAKGLQVTDNLNQETWSALTENSSLKNQPVLVNYTLTEKDIDIKTTNIPASAKAKGELEGMYYESVAEAIAEKFHMDLQYLQKLNPGIRFKAGETIIVYNPGNPVTTSISKVVAEKSSQTLFAYDAQGNLVASYPTTVGSTATPSPSGTHNVKVKVHEPNYTYTADDGEQTIIPPGPNNPVGLVWIGLTKPSYGIHGSPDPERISRQASSGCVRLTNWDALALFDVIDDDATVEFK